MYFAETQALIKCKCLFRLVWHIFTFNLQLVAGMKVPIKVVGAVEASKAPGVQTLEDNLVTKEVGAALVVMKVATVEVLVGVAATEMALVARHLPWDHMIRVVMEVDLCDKVEIVEAPWVVETDQLVPMVHPVEVVTNAEVAEEEVEVVAAAEATAIAAKDFSLRLTMIVLTKTEFSCTIMSSYTKYTHEKSEFSSAYIYSIIQYNVGRGFFVLVRTYSGKSLSP